MSSVIALSYSSKINGYLYPQRVSLPLKKNDMICSQKAMLPFQSGVTSHCCQYGSSSSFKKRCAKRPLLSAEVCHTRPGLSAE
jgi:hypothetical protein